MRNTLFLVLLAALSVTAFAGTAHAAGGTVTLKSYDQHLRVTVQGWTPRVQTDEFNAPDLGKKLVGVKVKVTNLSNRAYDDSLDNGASLSDNQHRSYDSTVVIDDSKPLINDARILPHDWATGWIFFEVPSSASPRLLSITLDSGFADGASGTGTWRF